MYNDSERKHHIYISIDRLGRKTIHQDPDIEEMKPHPDQNEASLGPEPDETSFYPDSYEEPYCPDSYESFSRLILDDIRKRIDK